MGKQLEAEAARGKARMLQFDVDDKDVGRDGAKEVEAGPGAVAGQARGGRRWYGRSRGV